jgi:hypothetical protein
MGDREDRSMGNVNDQSRANGSSPDSQVRRERRLVYRVVRDWLSLRRLSRLPSIDDVNPRIFSTDWHWTVIVRLVANNARFAADLADCKFEFIGDGFQEEALSPQIGASVLPLPEGARLRCTIAPIAFLIREGRPEPIVAQGTIHKPSAVLKFRSIALPFGDRAGAIVAKYVLGAFSGTLFAVSPDQYPEADGEIEFQRLDTATSKWVRSMEANPP